MSDSSNIYIKSSPKLLLLLYIYMKTAYVTPIIKQPNLDKSIFSNYRPISNLSTLSKTLERVVAHQLNSYLHENHILSPYQSAYTKHKSNETAMIHILKTFTYLLHHHMVQWSLSLIYQLPSTIISL